MKTVDETRWFLLWKNHVLTDVWEVKEGIETWVRSLSMFRKRFLAISSHISKINLNFVIALNNKQIWQTSLDHRQSKDFLGDFFILHTKIFFPALVQDEKRMISGENSKK